MLRTSLPSFTAKLRLRVLYWHWKQQQQSLCETAVPFIISEKLLCRQTTEVRKVTKEGRQR